MKPRKPMTLAEKRAAISAGTYRAMMQKAVAKTEKPKAKAEKRRNQPAAKKAVEREPIAFYDPARAARKGTMKKKLKKQVVAAAWKKAMKGDAASAPASDKRPSPSTLTQAQKATAWKKAIKG